MKICYPTVMLNNVIIVTWVKYVAAKNVNCVLSNESCAVTLLLFIIMTSSHHLCLPFELNKAVGVQFIPIFLLNN